MNTALAHVADNAIDLTRLDAAAMILGPAWDRIDAFSEMMCKGGVTVPKHLKGNKADCTAVVLQALTWRMNPFAVAQKTHITQGGALGYESQLVSAVLVSTGAITSEPNYEWVGDWTKVLGKVEERQGKERSDGTPGGKYYVGTWKIADEADLGVIVTARLARDGTERKLKILLAQAWPRFSTQWATDPMQQLAYLAVRKWARLYSPGSILGVYTNDELEAAENGGERHMGMVDEVRPAASFPQDTFDQKFTQWSGWIARGKKTVDELIAFVESSGVPLSEEQKAKLREVKVDTEAHITPAATPAPTPEPTAAPTPAPTPGPTAAPTTAPVSTPAADAAPAPKFAQVADRISKAKNVDALLVARDWIRHVDATFWKELEALADTREQELKAQPK